MPFIEEDKLATLYQEVDQEKKAAAFFQNLHQENKAKLLRYSFYRLGFFIAIAILVLGVIYSMIYSGKTSDEATLNRIEQLEFENKILGGSTADLQQALNQVTVFTVQLIATSNSDILLFSDHFVNFKAHPLKEFNAYSLGNFSTEEEAEAFRQELIKLGLKGVWVTSYKSGERILLNP